MSKLVKACAAADVAPGTGKQVTLEGKEIAIFNVDGAWFALDNECPHRGGPLAEGELEGCILTCPWHAWQFDLRTGESLTDDSKVGCYPVKVEGGDVVVDV
jgi:nitrite reductase (NADH) small subunit